MMNILVINGSPKPVSDTMVLTRAFLQGLTENGGCEVEIYDVIRHRIAPCRGCLQCMANADGRCMQQDEQNELLRRYVQADVVLYSFPLYTYGMPSHLKALIDRLLPLSRTRMVMENGRVRHVPLHDLSRQRTVVISGCGFPAWEKNFEPLRLMCRNCFPALTMVCVPEAPMLNVPEAAVVTEPLKAAFVQSGREYAATGSLSPETIACLETPMIPAEQYIAIVNGQA